MEEYCVKIVAQDAGKRLDLFLMDFFKNKEVSVSRAFLQKMIEAGNVTLNNSPLKPHYKTKTNDEFIIRLCREPEVLLQAEDIALEVVYEDDDLAVINKPTGLVVHPGAGNQAHTLVNALLHRFKNLSDISPERPGIVHRLDKETSGILVVAKSNFAHLALSRQFSRHTIKRKYIAIVKGKMEFDEGVIEVPIGRHPTKRKNMSAGLGRQAKYAKTYYRTLKRDKDFSRLELQPYTGRTHQLRVHLAFLGHPILGDSKYGKNNQFSRLALHAQSLGFVHPRTNKFVEFSSPLPAEFKNKT